MTHQLQEPLTTWFQESALRVNNLPASEELWNSELTRDEQIALGDDFETALQQYQNAVGMWMKVRKVSNPHIAVVEVARAINLILPNRAERLLQALGGHQTLPNSDRPIWDRSQGQLLYRGECVRKVKRFRYPSSVETVLNEFESAGWPEEIPAPKNFDANVVREALRSLRINLKKITFEQRAGGTIIRWQEV